MLRENGRVTITVKDSGYGMSQDVIDRVFELFYQAADQRLPKGGGLGIGLTLARTLVEMHGGTLTARSDGTDRGSEFAISLHAPSISSDAGRHTRRQRGRNRFQHLSKPVDRAALEGIVRQAGAAV